MGDPAGIARESSTPWTCGLCDVQGELTIESKLLIYALHLSGLRNTSLFGRKIYMH